MRAVVPRQERSFSLAATARRRRSRSCRPPSQIKAMAGSTRFSISSAASTTRRHARRTGRSARGSHRLPAARARARRAHRGAASRARRENRKPRFDPEPFDAARLAEWVERIRIEADATLAALESRLETLPDDARDVARAVLADAQSIRNWIDSHARLHVEALRTRYHGDYHLGQVLLTRNDFVITDLEGEPGRPLEERRRKASALKDIASMLRSFDYARAVAVRQFAAKRGADGAGVAALLEEWRATAGAEFLTAYRAALGDCAVYPRSAGDRVLRLAMLERLFYEIRYELDQRPDWVAVPLRDLRAAMIANG